MKFQMMKKLWLTLSIGVLALALNGCTPITTEPPCSGASCPVEVGQVDLLVSSPQLASNGATPVTITVRVRSTANAVVSDSPVTISADSGDLTVINSSTDTNGLVTATIVPGTNKANRTITVTATAGSITKTNSIQVTGTALTTAGVNAVTINTPLTVKATVRDSSGTAIPSATVTVSSSNSSSMPVSPTTATSDANGEIAVTSTPTASGTFSISFSALGATQTHTVTVNGDSFALTTSAGINSTNNTLLVNTNGTITVTWSKNGVAQAAQNVTFSATRGVFTGGSGTVTATTNGSGVASATLQSTATGVATITVSSADGLTSASLPLTYITNQATQISLQPTVTKVAANTNGSSVNKISLPALVRDSSNNLVKDAVVTYSIIQDASGGSLSSAQATTNISGVATIDYIAGTTTSGQDGVQIQAKVISINGIAIASASQPTTTLSLTVGGQGLFIRIGTDNTVGSPTLLYKKTYAALVTDAGGGAVANAEVTFVVKPTKFFKGTHAWDTNTTAWYPVYSASCDSEDEDNNGTLDAGEDINNSGNLTPGNKASITPSAMTDSTGFTFADITYTKDTAYWVEVMVTATAKVAGTEATDTATFILPGDVNDYSTISIAPPGQTSQFGTGNSCLNTQ